MLDDQNACKSCGGNWMSKVERKFANEIVIHKGKALTEAQTFHEARMPGGYTSIYELFSTWSKFLLEKGNDKEKNVVWPAALSVRPGHKIAVAEFRGVFAAIYNDTTEEGFLDDQLFAGRVLKAKEYQAFPAIITWGIFLAIPVLIYSLIVNMNGYGLDEFMEVFPDPADWIGFGSLVFFVWFLWGCFITMFVRQIKWNRLRRGIARLALRKCRQSFSE